MSKKLVNTIKQLGRLKGKTIKEIGEESGVGANTIYRWDKVEPKISTLKKVADYLDVDYKALLP